MLKIQETHNPKCLKKSVKPTKILQTKNILLNITKLKKGTKESVRKQIGMAVPPRGAKQIFEAILKTFAGVHYEDTESNIKLF